MARASKNGSPLPTIRYLCATQIQSSLQTSRSLSLLSPRLAKHKLSGSNHHISDSDPELQPMIHRAASASNSSIHRYSKSSNDSILKSPQGSHSAINKPQYGHYLHVPGFEVPGSRLGSAVSFRDFPVSRHESDVALCWPVNGWVSEGGLDEPDKAV